MREAAIFVFGFIVGAGTLGALIFHFGEKILE